ncbi:MAG: glutamine amidotransferase-related protein [Polyangiales bacterium]
MCVIDMNAGHQNQAIRCIGVLIDQLEARVRLANPRMTLERVHVSPRDKNEPIPDDCHLYIGSGGPGSPYDGDGQAWAFELADFFDGVVDDNIAHDGKGRSVMAICYSFEMAVRHFGVAEVAPRATRKFGVMPVYTTHEGLNHPLFEPFADRLFAFEHRNWEAIHLDESQMRKTNGRLLARESRDGVSKGRALMALDFAPGIEGVQFHPEADRPGVMAWVARPDQAEAFKLAYGITTYERMLKTLDDPGRLARTFAMMIPGWMTRKFNALALRHGWNPMPAPVQDMSAFGSIVPPPPSSVSQVNVIGVDESGAIPALGRIS